MPRIAGFIQATTRSKPQGVKPWFIRQKFFGHYVVVFEVSANACTAKRLSSRVEEGKGRPKHNGVGDQQRAGRY